MVHLYAIGFIDVITLYCTGICCWSFRKYLDWLVPRFVVVLDTSEDDVLVVALPALTSLGFSLKTQFHQVLPSLCNLLWRSGGQGQGGQRINALRAVLKSIRALVRQLHVAESTAVLVSPPYIPEGIWFEN